MQEVHENVPQRLHVVPSRLLNAEMSVDGCVSGRPGEVLVFPVRNVLMCAIITKLFGQSKIDGIDEVALFAEAHQEVVGFYITMNEVLSMYELDPTYLRINQGQKCLKVKNECPNAHMNCHNHANYMLHMTHYLPPCLTVCHCLICTRN